MSEVLQKEHTITLEDDGFKVNETRQHGVWPSFENIENVLSEIKRLKQKIVILGGRFEDLGISKIMEWE